MRHIVTISLVFFSLSHLAKAERVDAMRYLSQRYCDLQKSKTEQLTTVQDQVTPDLPQLFLSTKQLSVVGVLPQPNCCKFMLAQAPHYTSVVLAQPRNNSP